MKRVHFLCICLLSLFLVACSPKEKEAPKQNQEAKTTVAKEKTSQATTEAPKSDEEKKASQVVFNFYVHGESIGEFTVEDAEGKSVKEAMESNPEIKFQFNDAEGIIDQMFDHTNDPANGIYWSYLLNDQFAEKGVVSQKLKAGDKIAWYYGTEAELPSPIIPAEESSADTTKNEESGQNNNGETQESESASQ
ncbi:DUF4430 domain-containing protein [Vaginisenegalia massiliensis]|uniref:DUF4430 domain-containing protein n=1 Tax=Vaginisenegalia massiliensis TaxID=2058294 RepID=UPI000F546403|nr:DUF4430 domain-containing protein [Vaginisenegalia massiliensis]